MNYEFYTNSKRAWRSMFQEIEKATKSVYLEMYIFNSDTEMDFLNLLKNQARNGIKIKLILDSFGSIELSKKSIQELESSGVEILFLSYFMHRMHKKVLIIDERVAFLGGVNIHKQALNWRDLAVKIQGGLVRQMVYMFAKDYKYAGGKDSEILIKNKKIIHSKIGNWVFEHFPAVNKFRLKKIYKENFERATKDITLITPYFIPKRFLTGLLHQTILRGVKVTILVPEDTEYIILNKANYFYMTKCVALGVSFYLMPKMNHAKAMIIDNREAIIGSQNLDFLSFNFNSEVGVWFKDDNTVLKIKNIVSEWQRESKVFKPEEYRLNIFEKMLAHVLNFFVMLI
ncbi:MAG: phosphatidylserine/phosphatidylglycerophosphate/cardiolipin synthase family protein [bacterium]|nr:phosphatidylserine/phosphatidylglycerophosphate/cardiolipin synthase family protein [bacterium]